MKEYEIVATFLNGCAGAAKPQTYFEEAELVLVCKKLYAQDLDPSHVTDGAPIAPFYGKAGNWHRMYIGQVMEAYAK